MKIISQVSRVVGASGKERFCFLFVITTPSSGYFFLLAWSFESCDKNDRFLDAATLGTESIEVTFCSFCSIVFFFLFLNLFVSPPHIWTDYESPYINETEYHQIQPYVRSGFNHQSRDRNRFRTSYGSVITHRDRNQFDYVDERDRKSDADFYDARHYDHSTMHRWVAGD